MYDWNEPHILDRLNGGSGAQGFNQWLGVRGLAAGQGRAELVMDVRPDHCQHHGYVHGGCLGALADTACAWAGAAASDADVVTASYTLHLLAPAIGQRLRAKARTIRRGRSLVTVEAEVWVERDGQSAKQVAAAVASIAVLPERRPSVA